MVNEKVDGAVFEKLMKGEALDNAEEISAPQIQESALTEAVETDNQE